MLELLFAGGVFVFGLYLMWKSFILFLLGGAFSSEGMKVFAFVLMVTGAIIAYVGWRGIHIARIITVHHGF